MNRNPLLSCRAKVERAKKHLTDFQVELDAYSRRNPYTIITDEDSEPGVKIDRVRINEQIPTAFSGMIGDVAHNLMSTLDSLATSLVQFRGLVPVTEEVMRETYFPIHWRADGLDDARTRQFFDRIGPDAETIIRMMEPYRGGKCGYLFDLRRLNIIDKHRAIVPVAGDLAAIFYEISDYTGPPIPPRELTDQRFFPIKDGDELSRRAFHELEYDAHAHFTFRIAFGEGQVFEGRNVAVTLRELLDSVERIVGIFAKHVFKVNC
jgi:hypothetical protein